MRIFKPGRKARRIAELERELRDARENLVNVHIHTPETVRDFLVHEARKGNWYRVSYLYRVSEADPSFGDIADVFVGYGYHGDMPITKYFWGSEGDEP